MTQPTPLVALMVAMSIPGLLLAEDSDILELEPILVVTPSRAAEPIGDTIAAVSVITREDIELATA